MLKVDRFKVMFNRLKFRIRTFPTWLLWKYFKFNSWHVYGSTQPKYQGECIRILNELGNRSTIVEIGCGLGSILKSVDYQNRYGLDIEENVISAAKFLDRRDKINFVTGSFKEARKFQNIDVLLAVNWVHNLDPLELISELSYFTERKILVLTEGVEHYAFYHDESLFASHFKILKEVFVSEGKRHLFLLTSPQRDDRDGIKQG
jgi:hypothetical protein